MACQKLNGAVVALSLALLLAGCVDCNVDPDLPGCECNRAANLGSARCRPNDAGSPPGQLILVQHVNDSTGNCGAYTRRVRWNVDGSADEAGFIVQRIRVLHTNANFAAGECAPGDEVDLDYWEAWPVERGEMAPNFPEMNAGLDIWRIPPSIATPGEWTFRGDAVFVRLSLEELSDAGFERNSVTAAGSLYAMDDKPAFWDEAIAGVNTLERAVGMTYTCCPSGRSNFFDSHD